MKPTKLKRRKNKSLRHILLLTISLLSTINGFSQGNLIDNMAQIKQGVKSKRVSSYAKSGANDDFIGGIKDSSKFVLFNVEGAGIIKHIWITIAPQDIERNDIILRMYWDGHENPSVESPLGPFFGQGWNEHYLFNSMPLSAAPKDGYALVSYFAMPFSNGAKIEIENQTGRDISSLYYYVDYEEYEELPENLGRFHAWYNRELTLGSPKAEEFHRSLKEEDKYNKKGEHNYLIADIKGKGQFVGVNYYVHYPGMIWYGEGDDMFFIDGDKTPTLNGTGTEDYFNTSWGPKTKFQYPFYGAPRVNENIGWFGRSHVYRFHITDPVYFDKSLKFSIEHGHNNNMNIDLASVAYWYQQKPAEKLLPIPNKAQRAPKRVLGDWDMIDKRKVWLKSIENEYDEWEDE